MSPTVCPWFIVQLLAPLFSKDRCTSDQRYLFPMVGEPDSDVPGHMSGYLTWLQGI